MNTNIRTEQSVFTIGGALALALSLVLSVIAISNAMYGTPTAKADQISAQSSVETKDVKDIHTSQTQPSRCGDSISNSTTVESNSTTDTQALNETRVKDLTDEQKKELCLNSVQANQPHARVHLIEEGQTLSEISRKYNVSIDELVKLNDIKDPNRIWANSVLVLP